MNDQLHLSRNNTPCTAVCVCVCARTLGDVKEKEKDREREPQRRSEEVLLRAQSGFFLCWCAARGALFWNASVGVMALGSSETFPFCLKGGEKDASLLEHSMAPLHQNNEKVAEAESDRQRVPSSLMMRADRISLLYNNTTQNRRRCYSDGFICSLLLRV